MKKSIISIICLTLLLTACSKPKTVTGQFLQVCNSYMKAALEMKAAVKSAHQDIHNQGLGVVSTNMAAIMMIYQTKIEKPYGAWEKACFAGVKKTQGVPKCSDMVSYVQKPLCKQATITTYKAQFAQKKQN